MNKNNYSLTFKIKDWNESLQFKKEYAALMRDACSLELRDGDLAVEVEPLMGVGILDLNHSSMTFREFQSSIDGLAQRFNFKILDIQDASS